LAEDSAVAFTKQRVFSLFVVSCSPQFVIDKAGMFKNFVISLAVVLYVEPPAASLWNY
jgi:hypothetical protein